MSDWSADVCSSYLVRGCLSGPALASQGTAGRRAEGRRRAMTAMNMIQAINDAHDVVMARDVRVVAMGEDVGYFGGVFRATEHLQRKYGSARVFDTPISENGKIGRAHV